MKYILKISKKVEIWWGTAVGCSSIILSHPGFQQTKNHQMNKIHKCNTALHLITIETNHKAIITTKPDYIWIKFTHEYCFVYPDFSKECYIFCIWECVGIVYATKTTLNGNSFDKSWLMDIFIVVNDKIMAIGRFVLWAAIFFLVLFFFYKKQRNNLYGHNCHEWKAHCNSAIYK